MTLGRKRWLARSAGCVLGACVLEMTTPGCSLGEGSGYVTGTLNVPLCWSGPFNLNPTFFGAVPYMNSLDIRIQNGADISGGFTIGSAQQLAKELSLPALPVGLRLISRKP